MGHIEQVPHDQATGLLKRIYDAGVKRYGSVASIIQIQSQHPPSAQASMGLYMAIMYGDNPLPPSTRELLASVVSNVNDCYY